MAPPSLAAQPTASIVVFLHYTLSETLKQSTLGANSRWNLLPWQTLRPEALKVGPDFHGSSLPSKELH